MSLISGETLLFNEHLARYAYARSFSTRRRVLDVGCGAGRGCAWLAEVASDVIGMDGNVDAVAYAASHHKLVNTSFLVASTESLPFPPGCFDVITCFEVIENVAAESCFREIERVLKHNGVALISVPNRRTPGQSTGEDAKSPEQSHLISVLKQYFSCVEVRSEQHFSAIGLVGSDGSETANAVLEEPAIPNCADYWMCICSKQPTEIGDMVFVPKSSNIVLERNIQIQMLGEELDEREAEIAGLKEKLQESAAHAATVEAELAGTRSDCDRLQLEAAQLRVNLQDLGMVWSKATRWKRALIFGVSAPLDWIAGALVITGELFGRALRAWSPRPAPMRGVADCTRCSIIIVSWNGKDLLAESLPPLRRAVRAQGGNHEIIVVDNGSTDGTEEYVRGHFPEIRVVRSEQNLYFGGGNNLGVAHAKYDIVLLLNNDMIVEEDFLAPLLGGFSAPDVFAVGSQVFLADARKRREETGKTCATFNGCDLDWKHEHISFADQQQRYVPVFWGHGGAVAIDRAKFLWLGGFDPLFDPFYVEDADISYAAWKVGWQCHLAVESKVIHKHRSSTSRFGVSFITQIVRRNQHLFFWKHINDLDKLGGHFWRAARARMRRAGVPGNGIRVELRAFLGALERLPAVLGRRLRLLRSVVRDDQTVLDIISAPKADSIRSAYIDFSEAPYSDHLGAGWHEQENSGGRACRWTAERASAFVCAPANHCELTVRGYVPSLSSYGTSKPVLSIHCQEQSRRFFLREGDFEHRWRVFNLVPGTPVEVSLAVDHTIKSSTDNRTLGVIVRGLGFTDSSGRPATVVEHNAHRSVSLTRERNSAAAAPGQRQVLMVCAYLPYPGSGGGNLMFNLIRTLSQRHRLTVLSFYEHESELEHVAALAPYCENLEVIYRGQSFEASDPFGLKPPEIIYEFYQAAMTRIIRKYLSSQKFDVMQCEFLQTAHFAGVGTGIPAVLTNHEVLSLAYRKRFRRTAWFSWEKLKNLIAWMRMLNYESGILKRLSAVVVLTEPEAEFVARYAPGVPVYRNPMGVDCEYFVPREGLTRPKNVAFVGNFRHSPNVTGAVWFVEKVWPCVRKVCPAAQLFLVGGNVPADLQKWNGKQDITITGQVDDVRPYLARAQVVVAPVFDGAGMRTKVLEAWAMGKPVVGTRLAFEGISADAMLYHVAEDADTFAASISRLMEDQGLTEQLGKQARELVLKSYSWEAFADTYDRIYQQISPAADGTAAEMSGEPARIL